MERAVTLSFNGESINPCPPLHFPSKSDSPSRSVSSSHSQTDSHSGGEGSSEQPSSSSSSSASSLVCSLEDFARWVSHMIPPREWCPEFYENYRRVSRASSGDPTAGVLEGFCSSNAGHLEVPDLSEMADKPYFK
mmetsp:Transcript_36097/g.71044  ORF Transcript_36097/g.71044 Transcript_36097/m.71044 type:complete len:135 (+) Transcript_36097:1-405(+)